MAYHDQMHASGFEEMMLDLEHAEAVDPQRLIINHRASPPGNEMLDMTHAWQRMDSQQPLAAQLPQQMADASMANSDFNLSEDATQYLQAYVNCKNALEQHEAQSEQQLKDPRRAHNELGTKEIEVKRLEKEADRVKTEITNLKALVETKDGEINSLQSTLKEVRAALAIERDLQHTNNPDQHARHLQVLLDETIKGRDEEVQKLRNHIAQREQYHAKVMGDLAMKHYDATATLEEQGRQLTAQYEADRKRLQDEKQSCIDRKDEAVGKIQVELEEATMGRDIAHQERHVALNARDGANRERDLVVAQCQALSDERDEAIKKRDEAAAQPDTALQEINRYKETVLQMQLVKNAQNNSPVHGVPVAGARFATAPKVEDAVVLAKWKDLYAEITFLAAELNRCPEPNELDPKVVQLFCAILPADSDFSWEEYMVSNCHRKWLIEALLWEMVTRYLDNNHVWYGQIGAQLKTLLESMRNGLMPTTDINVLMQYSITRAEQVRVIQQLPSAGHDLASRDITVTLIKQQLHPFFPLAATRIRDQQLASAIHDKVNTLFWIAHELDCIFMQSLAHWKPIMRRQHNYWNPSFHEVPSWTGDVDVKKLKKDDDFPICFQVAPCLRKSGTSEGKSYDKTVAVMKGTVMPYTKVVGGAGR